MAKTKRKAAAKAKAAAKKPAKKPTKKLATKPATKPAQKPAKQPPPKPAPKPAKTPPVHAAAVAPAAIAPGPVAAIAPTSVAAPAPAPATAHAAVASAAAAPASKPAKSAKTPNLATQRKLALDGKTLPELKQMLKKNDQITTGTKPKLVKRILDCVTNGALPRCPSCGLGRLKFSKGAGFRCPGGYDDDEYVYCGYTAALGEIERPTWQFETPGIV
jgi:hypothetical protein